ncbi:MAG: ATPase [Candidatus Njordarchaeales archaeon]
MSENTYVSRRRYVVDLSLILSGALRSTMMLELLRTGKFYIPWAIINKLKQMASQGLEEGIVGIEELLRLRELGADIEYIFHDTRPYSSIDEIALAAAKDMNAILLTSNETLYKIAKAAGINSMLIKRQKPSGKPLRIRDFFDEDTLSVHLKEGVRPMAKKGRPGEWKFVILRDKPMTKEEIDELIREIIEEVRRTDIRGFVEIERSSSTIIQLEDLRIIITKPPFSDAIEITAVRPVKRLKLEDYNLPEKLINRLLYRAEGILIAGAPGMGKTTFAQALAEFYMRKGKIVKTIEAPRDMILPREITSYSKSFGTPEEIHDILLLSRPDYTIFDEMRNPEDFKLFADLRLAGVGMVGVIHATTAIDAIQRFIGKVELGMIPSIIDTVIFMYKGEVSRVLALKTVVKVPHGLQSEDLARPVVLVYDFLSNKPMYEIYTFGERTFVVPVSKEATRELYGTEEEKEEIQTARGMPLPYVIRVKKKAYIFDFGKAHGGKTVSAYLGSRFLFADIIGKSGTIRIDKRGKIGRIIKEALERGERIQFYEEEI